MLFELYDFYAAHQARLATITDRTVAVRVVRHSTTEQLVAVRTRDLSVYVQLIRGLFLEDLFAIFARVPFAVDKHMCVVVASVIEGTTAYLALDAALVYFRVYLEFTLDDIRLVTLVAIVLHFHVNRAYVADQPSPGDVHLVAVLAGQELAILSVLFHVFAHVEDFQATYFAGFTGIARGAVVRRIVSVLATKLFVATVTPDLMDNMKV